MIIKSLGKQRYWRENREPMEIPCIVFYNHSSRSVRENIIEHGELGNKKIKTILKIWT